MSLGINEVGSVSTTRRNDRMINDHCFNKKRLSQRRCSHNINKKVNVIYDDVQAVSDNMDSPSLISCLPHLAECITDLSLNGEVKSYVELYDDESKTPRRDTSIVFEDCSSQLPWNTTWCNQAKSDHECKISSTSNSSESLQDVQDDWKNYEPNPLDINWKMESKHSDSDKENIDPCQEYVSNSLYAWSSYNNDTGHLF